MSVDKPTEVVKINNTEISKDLVDETTKNEYDKFAKKMKEKTNSPKEAGEIFGKYAEKVLNGIKQNMLTTFSSITTEQLTSYEAAKNAFDADIQKYIKIQNDKKQPVIKKTIKAEKTAEIADDVYSTSINTPKKTTKQTEKQPEESKEIQNLQSLQTITHDIGLIIQLKKLDLNITTEDINDIDKINDLQSFLKTNNTQITNNEINTKLEKIKTTVTEKVKKEAEKGKVTEILSQTNTKDRLQVVNFIEKSKKEDFESVCKNVYEKSKNAVPEGNGYKNIKKLERKTGIPEEEKMIDMIESYANSNDVKDIKIGQTQKGFGDSFDTGTRVIQFRKGQQIQDGGTISIAGKTYTWTEEKKDGKGTGTGTRNPNTTGAEIKLENNGKIYQKVEVVRGTQADLQQARTNKVIKEVKDIDIIKTQRTKDKLNTFDDQGNFQTFKRFLSKQDNTSFFEDNIEDIINNIVKYKPTPGTSDAAANINELKNGYADVITNLVINNPKKLVAYTKYLTTENLNILGADTATRIKNYNLLVPELKKLENTPAMSKETQKRIIELGITIGAQPKLTPENMMSKGFDALIEQFGPMIFSVLKMFGFGKGSLLKMFGGAKDKINAMYKKEYGLSSEETKAIDNVVTNDKNKIDNIKIQSFFSTNDKGDTYKMPTGKEINKAFTNKENYIKNIQENENYKHINVVTFKTGLDAYNKENKTDLRINDIITITTDEKTKQQSISNIENKETFAKVMESILDNDATRSKIASANASIITEAPSKIKDRGYNEYIQNKDDRYAIRTQQDIARYLTASLFSNKDLSYIMTENELHNGKEKEVKKFPKKYIVNNPDGINLRDIKEPTKTDEKGLKDGEEITAEIDKEGKEITDTAKQLKLSTDDIGAEKTADLNKEIYKKIKTTDGKTRRVAEKFIKEKTVPTETANSTPNS